LIDGKGYAFEGSEGGQSDDDGNESVGTKVPVELSENRTLGIVHNEYNPITIIAVNRFSGLFATKQFL
jgi:hypothetical protein